MTNNGLELLHVVLIVFLDTLGLLVILCVLEGQQIRVLDMDNVLRDQREQENVHAILVFLEMNAIAVQKIILVITVNNLALAEVQDLFVLDMEHVMQEHLHPVGNVNVLLVGLEQIGVFFFLFFYFIFLAFSSSEYYRSPQYNPRLTAKSGEAVRGN